LKKILLKIYNKSSEIIKYRNLHERGNIKSLKLCADYHVWGGDIILDTKIIKLNGFQAEKINCNGFQQFKKLDN
jgi:hypothetical protein